jgi:1-acyl-sn-glycerol-3-phosphate acyltransferase
MSEEPTKSYEERRQELITELEDLTGQLQDLTLNHRWSFSPQEKAAPVETEPGESSEQAQGGALRHLQDTLRQSVFNRDVWKGVWYMLKYVAQSDAALVQRRLRGEFETDPWGFDQEFLDFVRPFLNLMYSSYFRVETTGLENVPAAGRALLVANHSGQLPWDGMMIGMAILNEHPEQRLVRTLYAAILSRMPYVSSALTRLGQTLATVENGTRLLEEEELVAVFPEGYKGVGKTFRDRYRLARFGRGGFAQMALNTGAPIIPVSVVGAEETYITLAKLPTIFEITGIPYVPITLTFPWLGLLGLVPLPTKWYIDFGAPILVDGYDPDAASNPVYVSQISDQVRNAIQEMIHSRLAQRHSVFFT